MRAADPAEFYMPEKTGGVDNEMAKNVTFSANNGEVGYNRKSSRGLRVS